MTHPREQVQSSAASYEFSAEESKTIGRTATYARWWGILSMVIASVQVTVGIVAMREMGPGVVQLPTGIAQAIVGIVFIQAAGSLRAVVQTEGNDVEHMLAALRELGVAFLVQLVTVAVGFLASVVLSTTLG
jgi:hypothetical protein